jgi:hypothetical protein
MQKFGSEQLFSGSSFSSAYSWSWLVEDHSLRLFSQKEIFLKSQICSTSPKDLRLIKSCFCYKVIKFKIYWTTQVNIKGIPIKKKTKVKFRINNYSSCYRFSISLTKFLVQEVSDFGFLKILECLHIHNEIYWGWYSGINMKSTYVLYIFHIYGLKMILCNVFILIFSSARDQTQGFT